MLRNELLIYFAQQNFYGGDTIKGYAELKCPLGISIMNVTGEFFCVEMGISKEGRQYQNFLFKTEKILDGPGSKSEKRGLISSWFGGAVQPNKLGVGNHQYPFEFEVPERVPPSFAGKYGKILYQIKVTAVVQKGSTPLISAADVQIAGTMFDLNFIGNSSTPVSKQDHKTFMFTSGIMNITAFLPSSVFRAGDLIQGELSYDNNTAKSVNKTKVELIQRIQFNVGKKIVEQNVLCTHNIGGCPKSKPVKIPFRLQVPVTVPEALLDCSLGKVKKLKYMKIQYLVDIEGEISMAQNYKCTIPIYVIRPELQEKLLSRVQQQQKPLPTTTRTEQLPKPVPRNLPRHPPPKQKPQQREQLPQVNPQVFEQPPLETTNDYREQQVPVYDAMQPVEYQSTSQLQKMNPPPPPTSSERPLPAPPVNTLPPRPNMPLPNVRNISNQGNFDDRVVPHVVEEQMPMDDSHISFPPSQEGELVYPDIQYPDLD